MVVIARIVHTENIQNFSSPMTPFFIPFCTRIHPTAMVSYAVKMTVYRRLCEYMHQRLFDDTGAHP